MRHLRFIVDFVLVVFSIAALAQESARTVQYHSQDIVPIRAKVKYTTLIELPMTEKIMEAATGDKEFWIVDVVGNFCFVHPAKQGINSNLNLITDKGNIYSFTLQDISATSTTPDLKVIVEPADRSAIVAASGPPQFVPAAQLEQSRQQLAALQSHVEQAVDEYKSAYDLWLKLNPTSTIKQVVISQADYKAAFQEFLNFAAFRSECHLTCVLPPIFPTGLANKNAPARCSGQGLFVFRKRLFSFCPSLFPFFNSCKNGRR